MHGIQRNAFIVVMVLRIYAIIFLKKKTVALYFTVFFPILCTYFNYNN